MEELTIIIPVKNEQDSIKEILSRIENEVSVLHTINIVYDSDEDPTINIVNLEKQKYSSKVNLIKNKYKNGFSNAVKSGIIESNSKYIIVVMADLCDDLTSINAMVKLAEEQNADIVCASRYMEGGLQINAPLIKSFLSKSAGLFLYHFFKVETHDSTNNFKLYRKTFLELINIESDNSFTIGLELVIKAHISGFKIRELPTVWKERTSGKRKFELHTQLPFYIKWVVKLFKLKFN